MQWVNDDGCASKELDICREILDIYKEMERGNTRYLQGNGKRIISNNEVYW